MNLLTTDVGPAHLSTRLPWNAQETVAVSGSEPWLRASRRSVDELRDEQGSRIPLRDELWLTVYPPRPNGLWRCEAVPVGPEVVGRGQTPDQATHDWRIRFRTVLQRFLEMRPFEMSEADCELWNRIQAVIDVPGYKATKPMILRQVGKVTKTRTGLTVVQWEDGAREKVNPDVFDEAFASYSFGQRFEATVTRNPRNFRLVRATAVRKLSAEHHPSPEKAKALWERVVGDTPAPTRPEVDEEFWLKTTE